MESRDAHAHLARNTVDSKGLIKVFTQTLNGAGDGGTVTAWNGNVAELIALIPRKKTIDNFLLTVRTSCKANMRVKNIREFCRLR